MSQATPGTVISIDAGGSISAYRVVYVSGDHAITLWGATNTTAILGVSMDGGAAGTSIPVVISGTAKVEINDSVTAGQLLMAATSGSGRVIGTAMATATVSQPILGICLDTVSGASCTGAVVEVALTIGNPGHLV